MPSLNVLKDLSLAMLEKGFPHLMIKILIRVLLHHTMLELIPLYRKGLSPIEVFKKPDLLKQHNSSQLP